MCLIYLSDFNEFYIFENNTSYNLDMCIGPVQYLYYVRHNTINDIHLIMDDRCQRCYKQVYGNGCFRRLNQSIVVSDVNICHTFFRAVSWRKIHNNDECHLHLLTWAEYNHVFFRGIWITTSEVQFQMFSSQAMECTPSSHSWIKNAEHF